MNPCVREIAGTTKLQGWASSELQGSRETEKISNECSYLGR